MATHSTFVPPYAAGWAFRFSAWIDRLPGAIAVFGSALVVPVVLWFITRLLERFL